MCGDVTKWSRSLSQIWHKRWRRSFFWLRPTFPHFYLYSHNGRPWSSRGTVFEQVLTGAKTTGSLLHYFAAWTHYWFPFGHEAFSCPHKRPEKWRSGRLLLWLHVAPRCRFQLPLKSCEKAWKSSERIDLFFSSFWVTSRDFVSACDNDRNQRLELIRFPVGLRRPDFNESSLM